MAHPAKLRVLSADEIAGRLAADLPFWRHDSGFLKRVYKTHGWKGTLMVVNAIGHLAEAAWHHPDIHASWPSVEVRLQTHDAGGITDRDFELAAKIEEVVMWRPGRAGGALEGVPETDERFAYVKYDEA